MVLNIANTSKIEFRRTGNFWIDNGIVALYRILLLIREDWDSENVQVNPHLNEDSLTVEVTSSKDDITIITVLNRAKDKATGKYLGFTKNAGWIFKDDDFEMYQLTDFKMHLKPFFTGKTSKPKYGSINAPSGQALIELLESEQVRFEVIKNKQGKETGEIKLLDYKQLATTVKEGSGHPNLILSVETKDEDDKKASKKNRLMKGKELKLFLSFKSLHEKRILSDGQTKFKVAAKGYLELPPVYEIGQLFEQSFTQEGRKRCFFSGELFKNCDEVSGMDYPFMTGSSSGGINFASNLSAKTQISAKYSFAALFSFYNLHYLLNGDYKNYFVLYDSNLLELSYFYAAVETDATQLTNETWCNFKHEMSRAEYEAESVLAFAMSIYRQLKDELRYDELYTKSIFTFLNDGNIFRDVKQYTSLVTIFKLFTAYNETDLLDIFTNFVRSFTRRYEKAGKTEYDTLWRNRLCSDILTFRPIYQTIEGYLGEVKMREETGIPNLNKLIQIYHQNTQTSMKAEMVERCKQIGNSIGRYCRGTEDGKNQDKGLLFSIRNSRNRIDFLKVLSESQFRTEIPYSEEFFKELPDSPQWEEYKSLVSIFAMNSFLYKNKKSNPSEPTPQAS